MTHIIIHTDEKVREKYLLKLISYLLKREISKITEIRKIPDIHILDGKEGSIGIESVKTLQKEMIFKPFQEKYQIAVILDAFSLTEEAQNSFLKTLEEQSNETVYILLLDNENSVLRTILSRGIKHYVKEKGEEIVEENEKPKILKMDLVEQFKEIEKISQGDLKEVIGYLSNIERYFRKKMKEKMVEGKSTNDEVKKIRYIETAMERLRGNGNKRLVLENMMIQILK